MNVDKNRQGLEKIYKHVVAVLQYCRDCDSLETFQADPMRAEACVFNLMQIGELAKHALEEECKAMLPTIPWKQLYGMRNRIVHEYAGVELRIVWDTIHQDLPVLRSALETALQQLPPAR